MNRMLLAVLLAATPAFAHRHEREYDDDRQDGQSWQGDDERSGAYGDERYDWSLPNDDEGWQSDDSGYAAARGPTYGDFRNDAELSGNGEWIDTPEYGTVWRPRRPRDGTGTGSGQAPAACNRCRCCSGRCGPRAISRPTRKSK